MSNIASQISAQYASTIEAIQDMVNYTMDVPVVLPVDTGHFSFVWSDQKKCIVVINHSNTNLFLKENYQVTIKIIQILRTANSLIGTIPACWLDTEQVMEGKTTYVALIL